MVSAATGLVKVKSPMSRTRVEGIFRKRYGSIEGEARPPGRRQKNPLAAISRAAIGSA